MTYLYLTTAVFMAFFAANTANNWQSNFALRFPAIVGTVVYSILAAKGFGLI